MKDNQCKLQYCTLPGLFGGGDAGSSLCTGDVQSTKVFFIVLSGKGVALSTNQMDRGVF